MLPGRTRPLDGEAAGGASEPADDVAEAPSGITEAQRNARRENAAKAAEGRRAAAEARRTEAAAQVAEAKLPPAAVSEARLMNAKAELAAIELAAKRGELIEVEKARTDVVNRFAKVRTLLLGVPNKLAQRDRSIPKKHLDLVKELIRDSLTELADGGGAGDDADG